MDILSYELINRSEGIKSVVTLYQVLKSSFLSNASHLNLEVKARKISNNVSSLFCSQMLSIKTSFREKIAHLKSAKETASFLIVEHASLATTYPDVCTAHMMYMAVRLLRQRGLFYSQTNLKLSSKLHVPRET